MSFYIIEAFAMGTAECFKKSIALKSRIVDTVILSASNDIAKQIS